MKKRFIQTFSLTTILLLISAVGFAQDDSRTVSSAAGELYVISAKAGGINLIQGDVSVKREGVGAKLLIKGDNLKVGEKVITDRNSKAEILLNPGSFARLGENSEFEFKTTSLDDLKLHLTRGYAIFEVYADNDFKITLTSSNARFYLVKSGVYRMDILSNGSTRLQVWKGQAQVGDINSTKVKKSREVIVKGSDTAVAKFDKDVKDPFDEWSKDRAKELAQANARLQRNTLRNSLYNSFGNNRWSGFNGLGLWAFDASFGGYCFLPFGNVWNSPYGYGFSRNFFSSRPSYNFYNRVYQGTAGINNGSTGNRTNEGSRRDNRARIGNQGTNPGANRGNDGNSGGMSPSRIAPPMSSVRPSAPNLNPSRPVRSSVKISPIEN